MGYNMTITFYKTVSSENQIQKVLTDSKTFTGTFKNDLGILNPKIIISDSDYLILDFNYCFIHELNRYYFVKNITILSNNRFLIDCKIDVLKSYADDLQHCTGRIIECENNYNTLNCETEKNNDSNIIEYNFDDTSILDSNGSILLITQK